MTPTEKSLVQKTFAEVAPIADRAAALFYGRLFELDPSLRPLFKGDMTAQGKKLMQVLGYAVSKLDALDELVPAVAALGRKHAGYGVKESDYETVGAALIWTLGQGLGPAFTSEVQAAWTSVYGVLAGTMTAAAKSVDA
ncbi:MAG TPA: globin family protein [Polyangia bacterium]|nr:globin family protein [Polyangia bacterium]